MVVIGAGIGGLFCATELVRAGLRVLLVEQHYMVGGYCSTFRRGGYTFDAATHFYPLLGNPSTLTGKILAELGLGDLRWVQMDPVDTFHFPDGSQFRVPADYDTYRAALSRDFPEQQAALEAFFTLAREAYLVGLLAYFRGRETPRFKQLESWTLQDALDRLIPDPKLRLLLAADCAHWGSRPGRTSFVFDSMLRFSYFLGNFYPAGGSQVFADALAGRFEELGGDLMIHTRATRILTNQEAPGALATGVELLTEKGALKGSHRVRAGVVVANGDLLATLDQLLPPTVVAAGLREQLGSLRPSFPCFLTHLGLEGVETAALEAVQGYYWADWDTEQVGRQGLRCKIFAPTVYEPAMAPPGGQVVILQKVLEMDYHQISDWPRHKQEVEDGIFGHFCKVLPGVADRVVVKLSASARTSWRFTQNYQGAMLGWEMAPDQLGERRPEKLLDNLHLVGHWTRPGGGITPVIVSAIAVAREILQGPGAAYLREAAAHRLGES